MNFAKNIGKVDEKHHHANKTLCHNRSTNSECLDIILHQFQSSAQINH